MVPNKVKYGVTIWLSNFTLRYTPKRIETMDSNTCTQMFMATLFITAKECKQLKVPSTDEQINKMYCIQTLEYYLARKKGRNTDACSNMDEPYKQYAKSKKPDMEDHTYCDLISMK